MPVTQCRGSERRSATHDAVDCVVVSVPAAWAHGAASAPLTQDHRGAGPPWSRRAAVMAATSVACSAEAWVRVRRAAHWAIRPRTGSACARANAGMVSPLLIDRPRPLTFSVAQRRPAVSSTIAPSGSATMKELS